MTCLPSTTSNYCTQIKRLFMVVFTNSFLQEQCFFSFFVVFFVLFVYLVLRGLNWDGIWFSVVHKLICYAAKGFQYILAQSPLSAVSILAQPHTPTFT